MRQRKSSPIIKAKRHRSSASREKSKNSKNYNLASKIAMAAIAMYIGYNVRKKIDQRKIKVLQKHLISLTKNNHELLNSHPALKKSVLQDLIYTHNLAYLDKVLN